MAISKRGKKKENPGELLQSISLIHCGSGNVASGAELLRGKAAALAIGPFWLPKLLAKLISEFSSEYLEEIKAEGKPIEFVYVAVDRTKRQVLDVKEFGDPAYLDERRNLECFNNVVKELGPGWLAVPYEEARIRAKLLPLSTEEFCGFVFVGENGEILTTDGLNLMLRWGAQGFPYTEERIAELEKQEVEWRANQTLESVLATPSRDFVVKNDGTEVKVESLRGKPVALFFTANWFSPCWSFTEQLLQVYQRLQGKLEVVIISHDRDEASFSEHHNQMPWLAIPFSDTKHRKQLNIWFNVESIPALVFLDEHGKTITTDDDNNDAAELVITYGADGFPFTPARIAELEAIEEQKRGEQSIETLLIRNNRDDLLAPGGNKVKVSELVGKTVGLYFSARWSGLSRCFTPLLATVHEELKREGEEFEVVFISFDDDEYKSSSSSRGGEWLALPFSDRPTKCQLSSYFGVSSIPTLVIIGPDGKTVTSDGVSVVSKYGAAGFPYTEEQLRGIDKAKRLWTRVKLRRHAHHTLVLDDDPCRRGEVFRCDVCGEKGGGIVYRCSEDCGYDVHPRCAKAEVEADKKWEAENGGGAGDEEGWVRVGRKKKA